MTLICDCLDENDRCCCGDGTNSGNGSTGDEINPETCTVIASLDVSGGTANLLSQKIYGRSLYDGKNFNLELLNLEPSTKVEYGDTVYTFLAIVTSSPIQINYHANETDHFFTCNKCLLIDYPVNNLVLSNQSEAKAIVNLVKLS